MNCKYCQHWYVMHLQLRKQGQDTDNTWCMECSNHCLLLWDEAKKETGK